MNSACGEAFPKTVCRNGKVEIVTELTKNYTEMTWVEVEVGAAGHYQHFEALGKKGRAVLMPGSEHGVFIDMILDQNPRTFPYHDSDWQAAAKH